VRIFSLSFSFCVLLPLAGGELDFKIKDMFHLCKFNNEVHNLEV
jgi:hypothetical protein